MNSHEKGYSTIDNACASASLGVTAKFSINTTLTATTQKKIQTFGSIIKVFLKESFKEEFEEEFKTGYSLDVAFDWLGISSSGEYYESKHESAFQIKESYELARKRFAEAIKTESNQRVRIEGSAEVEGRSSFQSAYCIFFASEKVEFKDGTQLFVVNDDPRSGGTATPEGVWVPNKSFFLNVELISK